MRYVVASILALASGVSMAAEGNGLEGTWAYYGQDAGFEVRLQRDGECSVNAAASVGGYFAQCTYTVQWPNVDLTLKGSGGDTPLRLVMVAGGEMMRVEGEAKRPLRRDWNVPPPLQKPTSLDEPGAMANLAARDPEGYRKVVELVDLVTHHGCQGAFQAEIGELVQWDFLKCGSMDDPPNSLIGFHLGDARYFISIYGQR